MAHIVEILSVGTELLLGNIVNLDAQILSQGLSELGLNVYYHTVVGDNPQRAKEAVAVAKKRANIIITTGGLGPTCDDLTKNVLAEAFGKELYYDARSAQFIHDYFARVGRLHAMTDNNMQQAMLPEGCVVFDNDWGTAPGCAFFAEGCHVLMLPGPPSECKAMFRHRAVPYLQKLSEGIIASHTIKLFGIGESQMEAQLRDRMTTMTNPTLAPYAKTGECELRVTAKSATAQEAEALLAPMVQEMVAKFGGKVYGVDVDSLEAVVLSQLVAQNKTLGTAESCTGGLISTRITDIAGASCGFVGGIVAYSNQIKTGLLGVPQAMLDEFGAVSAPVAAAMAEGARRTLNSDIALSATGVAGPDRDDRGNNVGIVFVAIATEHGTHVRPLKLGTQRNRVRISSAHNAFDLARRYLTNLPYEDD